MLERISDILTFSECRRVLKIGKTKLLELLRNGEIEAFRIGNRWKIPKAAVIEYIRDHL